MGSPKDVSELSDLIAQSLTGMGQWPEHQTSSPSVLG